MRKVMFVVVMMLVVSSFVFSENISELNGFDWLTWSTERKIGYVQGFMSGHAALRDRFAYEGMDDADLSDEYFFIPLDVGTVAQRLDEGYQPYDNREIPIHYALYIVVAKDYWSGNTNDGSNKNEEAPEAETL